ncbi:MAG: hydrogenase 4 subunit B [Deltaproteobacteria bacterium]|nr:hydrogenase 4 subunit B [Deltaproteobacteria bacterium]
MPSPFDLVSASIVAFLFISLVSAFLARHQRFLVNFSSLLSAAACLLAATGGFLAVLSGGVEAFVLPIGLPDLPFYMRLDALSGFFVTLVGLLGFFVSIYSAGYLRGFLDRRSVAPLIVFCNIFMAGMILVLIADDAYFFMVSWELMAVSSFFLVFFEDEQVQNRRAAFIYILIAHIGAILILLSFGIMAGFATGFESFRGYTFEAMRSAEMPAVWASIVFIAAFLGFAAKAGVIPLHVWLPEAHPAAPSNISALMSGVMLKTAIYGILRVGFDLASEPQWWWGGMVLVFGLFSAVLGILYALMQDDIKRLLAYSSVENIGITLIAVGLAMIFAYVKMNTLAALAMAAALYHMLNHAVFKGLLFMGAGAVLHATHERSMEGLGGLIHKMKWTAPLFLVGCLAASGLPPFNGFVSEWLIFQSFLLTPALPGRLLNLLIPLGAAALALAAALSARGFVKVFGITFLGQWRGKAGFEAVEVNWPMRAAMMMAAASCLALGVFPTHVIGWLDSVPQSLVGGGIGMTARASGWLWLTPVASERASYSAPLVFFFIAFVIGAIYLAFKARRVNVRRAPMWDCGFEKVTPRMQYTATSMSMPTRRIFGFVFSIKESVRAVARQGSLFFPEKYIYHLKVRDRVWNYLYKPVSEASFYFARRVGKLQHGRIQIYLLYSFVTLVVLLVFA